jgi:tetratricopeptide (TPR) repeat protein
LTTSDKTRLKNDLDGKLKAIRLHGYAEDPSETAPLLYILGYDKPKTDEQINALLIRFVSEYVHSKKERDILLMAFRLLSGYEELEPIGSRRRLYVEESGYRKPEESIDKACDRLRKKEDILIAKLVGAIATISDMSAFIEDVDGYLQKTGGKCRVKYPRPSYLKEDGAFGVSLPDSRILTPNAPRWGSPDIFLGRDAFVGALCRELQSGTSHLQLTGMGGIGKTAILNRVYANIADKCAEHGFGHVGLLFYDGSMDAAVTGQIDYPVNDDAEKVKTDAVWAYLRALCDQTSVLLLIDDIRPQRNEQTTDESFRKLFTLKAAVLLASRTPFGGFEDRPVEHLPAEECARIFEAQFYRGQSGSPTALPEDDRTVLTQILERRVGRNTLIVTRLGALARNHKWSVKELEDRLDEKQFNIHRKRGDKGLQEEISKLYSLTDVQDPAEISVLEAFAIFPAIPLDIDTCVNWLREDAGTDEDDCRLILNELSERTWLTLHTDGGSDSFSMHQLVRAAVGAQTKIKLENHLKLLENCRRTMSFGLSSHLSSQLPQYFPFAIALAEYYENESHAGIIKLMMGVGHYCVLFEEGDRRLEWQKKALAACEKTLGPEHPETAAVHDSIGNVYCNCGDYGKALASCNKALEIFRTALEPDWSGLAHVYGNIANIYSGLGDNRAALEFCKKAMKTLSENVHADHPTGVSACLKIADVYTEQKNYGAAIKIYRKALEYYETKLGNDILLTAVLYVKISKAYYEQKEYDKALETALKALAIQERELGDKNSTTLLTRAYAARVYVQRGNYPVALELYYSTLDAAQKSSGCNHPEIVGVFYDIASVHFAQGDYPESIKWYLKCLNPLEKILGRDNRATVWIYDILSKLYFNENNLPEALKYCNKVLVFREKSLGPEHPSTAEIYRLTAKIYRHQGNYDEALKWCRKALPIYESNLGANHLDTNSLREFISKLTALKDSKTNG